MRTRIAAIVFLVCLACGLWGAPTARAQETQVQYLSGHDKDDAVRWNFLCTDGRNAGRQTTILVPSNWELQGFGTFSYGGQPRPAIQGRYTRTFTVPDSWAGRRIVLVFEGVMTDTSVLVNGVSAGPMHQGGFYRFQYDITRLVKAGQSNSLAVSVDAESANASINRAERDGDYWNFSGIYRPVYLEAFPAQSIERVAVNARADGRFAVDVFGQGLTTADTVEAQIEDLRGHAVGRPFTAGISAAAPTAHLQTRIDSPRLWTAETPNRYRVAVRLKHGATVLHQMRQTFGFRTMELRPGEGIFVNGHRVLLKGSNRHSFWPDSGRCLSDKISRMDIALMKDMNMNAVRMSHYPPDQHFLDDCDELGLYVLDELGGWQHAYDTPTAHRLVQELVVRDVNHPSILIWDNANEYGWNAAVDNDFALWDPQARPVNHPKTGGDRTPFNGLLDSHYPTYSATQIAVTGGSNPTPYVFMPTEFLHGLFDGGAGAGLADYWEIMRRGKVSGGGFIWSFLDEGVKRVDQGGRIDVVGNAAPDGILGPYRQKEGSYETIKQVWSPVAVTDGPALPPDFAGTLHVENRYDFTDLNQCRFVWELRRFRRPAETQSGFTVLSRGTTAPAASIPPGTSGTLSLSLPGDWRRADALAVRALDPQGHELWTWVWPLAPVSDFRAATRAPGGPPVTATDTADAVQVRSGALTLAVSKTTGQLTSVQRGGHPFSLTGGPRLVTGEATLTALEHHADGGDQVITATYTGAMKSVTWRVRPNGWVQVDWNYTLDGPQDFFGVGFDYPEANVKSMRWLGDGPYRTWKNRRAGGTLNVWQSAYNDTITGDAVWQYPEFKGYYGGVRWAQFQTTEGRLTAVLGQDDLFLQVFIPAFPPANLQGKTGVAFPKAGLSFLHAIPPIGSKFSTADTTGPQGQPPVAAGDYHGSVSLYFGDLAP